MKSRAGPFLGDKSHNNDSKARTQVQIFKPEPKPVPIRIWTIYMGLLVKVISSVWAPLEVERAHFFASQARALLRSRDFSLIKTGNFKLGALFVKNKTRRALSLGLS